MNAVAIATVVIAIISCILVVTSLLFNWHIKKVSLYYVISVFCAIVLLLINIKDASQILGELVKNSSINPLKILVFFLCMTILSITLDNLGFFNYLATKCTKLAKNSQTKLFLTFYFLVSLLTIFTSNDIVILAFVPFICYFCKRSKINPAPYVFATFVSANTWSMLFIIGNPTNVYIGTFPGISFVDYFLKMAIPTLVCGIVSLGLLLLLFRKKLKVPIEQVEETSVEINKPLVIINACILGACTVLLAISSYIGLEMWYIALGFSVFEILLNLIICLCKKQKPTYVFNSIKRAPWAFVPFLVAMFLIIMCLEVNGITKILFDLLQKSNSVIVYGVSSFVCSNLMNNIPMTALFASILNNGAINLGATFATIIGSNLGALLTPVGALAGIMFMKILKEKEIDFSIKSFIGYGAIISIVCLFATLSMLLIFV